MTLHSAAWRLVARVASRDGALAGADVCGRVRGLQVSLWPVPSGAGDGVLDVDARDDVAWPTLTSATSSKRNRRLVQFESLGSDARAGCMLVFATMSKVPCWATTRSTSG